MALFHSQTRRHLIITIKALGLVVSQEDSLCLHYIVYNIENLTPGKGHFVNRLDRGLPGDASFQISRI